MDYKKAISLLGVSTESSLDDIEKAYKNLVQEYHPDLGGSDKKMAELNEARDFLREYFAGSNFPAILQQFEVAVRDMNAIAINQRNVERKVEKATEDVRKTATNRLKNWRQIALVFAAISVAAIFLGKDIPKEIVNSFHIREIAIPTKVDRPLTPEIVKNYRAMKPTYTLTDQSIEKLKSEGFSEKTLKSLSNLKNQKFDEKEKYVELLEKTIGQEQANQYKSLLLKYSIIPIENNLSEKEKEIIASYKKDFEKYYAYKNAIETNRQIKERNRVYSLMWYTFTFGLGICAALIAWYFNQRIRNVEIELSEFNDELLRKSSYFSLLKDLFSDQIPSTWTEKALVDNANDWHPEEKSWKKIYIAIGSTKFVNLVLLKGQENGFLKIIEGNEQNNYVEKYSIANVQKT